MNGSPVVQVDDLHKRYGRTIAVETISFDVHAGEIFGLIGPNGAGKTTMECAEGVRRPDREARARGDARRLVHDALRRPRSPAPARTSSLE